MTRRPAGAVLQHLHKLLGQPSGEELTDGVLVERFIAGREEAAFELLVRRHGALVLRVCRRVLRDTHAAEDAFQATFLVLVRKAASIRRHESLGSWLYGVAYRVARKASIRSVKRHGRERPITDLPGQAAGDGLRGELRQVLDEELVRLADRHRAPLVLCYLQGKTYGQAARELGWSEGSMSRRLAQARDALRQRLLRRGVALTVSGLGVALTAERAAAMPAHLIEATVRAAAGPLTAAGSGAVATLVKGMVHDMFLIKLKTTAGIGLALSVVAAGLGLATYGGTPPPYTASESTPARSSIVHSCELPYAFAELLEPPDCPEDEANQEMDAAPEDDAEAAASRPDLEEIERLFRLPAPATIVIKRRDLASEDELRRQLQRVPELTLDAQPGQPTTKLLAERARKADPEQKQHFTPDVLAVRTDLAGLPLRKGADCELVGERLSHLQARSRELRQLISDVARRNELVFTVGGTNPRTPRPADSEVVDPTILARTLRVNFNRGRDFKDHFQEAAAVPALVQMLTPEGQPVRRVLVEQLAKIRHPSTTTALARIALYDLSPDVRADAIQALTERPAEEYRAVLLEGFRYPWAPVADHAAEALVTLGDRGAAAALQQLAGQPDPLAPVVDGQKETTVAELVRVNHLRNCMMCHAPAQTGAPLLAPVPVPGEPLPPPALYYHPKKDLFALVRADITYLRQDFSLTLAVDQAAPWPAEQRYDYLVRRRPVTAAEPKQRPTTYPQREAVLYALGELRR